MRTKTDVMELLNMICDFYEAYRDVMGLDHEEARQKISYMYTDLHLRSGLNDLINVCKGNELVVIEVRKKNYVIKILKLRRNKK